MTNKWERFITRHPGSHKIISSTRPLVVIIFSRNREKKVVRKHMTPIENLALYHLFSNTFLPLLIQFISFLYVSQIPEILTSKVY